MKIYNYHPDTKEYTGESKPQQDPMQSGKFLIPAYATIDPPPKVGTNKVAIRDSNKWIVLPDYRGNITHTGKITTIGQIPDHLTINADNLIEVDMDKARKIHMAKIRIARNKKLQELDIEIIRIIEGTDFRTGRYISFGNIPQRKQILRDIPQTFDLTVAKTPEELNALWPKELSGME